MQGQDLLQTPENYPGRAIMQFDNNQAYMVGDQVVIHTPNKPATQYVFRNGQLEPTHEQPGLIRDALAQVLWPIIAYRERQYRLDKGYNQLESRQKKLIFGVAERTPITLDASVSSE